MLLLDRPHVEIPRLKKFSNASPAGIGARTYSHRAQAGSSGRERANVSYDSESIIALALLDGCRLSRDYQTRGLIIVILLTLPKPCLRQYGLGL